MTPHEFECYVQGRTELVEYEQELVAWQTAHIINPHIKGTVSAAQLLGKDDGRRQIRSFRELEAIAEENEQ